MCNYLDVGGGTLNNIVGIGHRHHPQLNNVILEMMVHIGPLSPNDASQAKNNPGQNQLTENYSGKDFDGDGIDDHFDVDSHAFRNSNDPTHPDPGVYTSGVDSDGDGIDDADLLPVVIGDFAYSIWYGQGQTNIIIYSRETNASLTNDFDPLTPDMDLSTEGKINLSWNDFLDFTLNDMETLLQNGGISWAFGANNPFPAMNASGGAIGGIEFGVEPQTNDPIDAPYSAILNIFEVKVDGAEFGLNPADTIPPTVAIDPIITQIPGLVSISGTSVDNVRISRNRLMVRNTGTGQYWTGYTWTDSWAWFAPIGTGDWAYDILLPSGDFRVAAWTWDTTDNRSTSVAQTFSLTNIDITNPTVSIDAVPTQASGLITVSGSSTDNVGIDRNKLLIQNHSTGQYWTGTAWSNNWAWFDPVGSGKWHYDVTLSTGTFRSTAWAWDTSNNRSISTTMNFMIENSDNTPPTVSIITPNSQTSVRTGAVSIQLQSSDNTAIDRNRLLVRNLQTDDYWNGTQWVASWTWFSPGLGSVESAMAIVPLTDVGSYRIIAWTWDTTNNISNSAAETIDVTL